jgi:hypothetical protein
VSLIYKDASLGNPVQIAVVRMLLLKDQEFVLTTATGDDSASSSKESHEILDSRPGKSASEMLRNFCKWQRVFNDMDDSSPYHHDTALLLTRYLNNNNIPLTEWEINNTHFFFIPTGKTFAGILNCRNVTRWD